MIYHVAQQAAPAGDGSAARPFSTIGAAAAAAQPGDTVLIHSGIYREWVSPPRGGSSDEARICYRGAEGEWPVITAAEPLTGWQPCGSGVWRAEADNALFGDFNPYKEVLAGDWFDGLGQTHHTGEVFADGQALAEAASLDDLMAGTSGRDGEWFAEVLPRRTVFYARFHGQDPNTLTVEISVRPFCFFPREEGVHYITLSGVECCCAATQWAPPTAFQPGAVGPHWSKGWVIENCRIHDAKCCGISLGKNRDPKDNRWSLDPDKGGAQTYTEMIFSALWNGWCRERIGGHIVRGNEIWNCGQAGIVGCMGGAFCRITGNHIHHIALGQRFTGAEIAGIKLHAAIDVLIEGNAIHHCVRGLWLDWQAQGAVVRSNAFFRNGPEEDLFLEVCHGPCLVENNLLLSASSFLDVSQGTACLHNLFAGKLFATPDTNRFTPYHQPHSTRVAGMMLVYGGDDRFLNNIFLRGEGTDAVRGEYGTKAYESYSAEAPARSTRDDTPAADLGRTLPITVRSNLYLNGAAPWSHEKDARVMTDRPVRLAVVEAQGHYWLETDLAALTADQVGEPVTTAALGLAFEPEQPYTYPDGSPLEPGCDFAGTVRGNTPRIGPLEQWPARLLLV